MVGCSVSGHVVRAIPSADNVHRSFPQSISFKTRSPDRQEQERAGSNLVGTLRKFPSQRQDGSAALDPWVRCRDVTAQVVVVADRL